MTIVHIAETGRSFELTNFHPLERVVRIQEVLEPLTGVPRQDQLLFCGESRLDSQRTLDSYNLDDEQRPVFLFNRRLLVQNSPPPPLEHFPENVKAVVPSTAMEASSFRSDLRVFESASDPSIRALPSYETQFRYQFQRGSSLLIAGRNMMDACHKLVREMEVQAMAMQTVQRSMETHGRGIDATYTQFMAEADERHPYYTSLLESLGRDLEKLRACKLHPNLRTGGRQSLLDCVEEDVLRRCLEECSNDYRKLRSKVNTLRREYEELKTTTQSFLEDSSGVNVQQVVSSLQSCASIPEEEEAILDSLRCDVIEVKTLLDHFVRGRCTGARAQDGVSAMHEMQQTTHIPRMEECDYKLERLLHYLVDRKNAMNLHVHGRMQKCASLQARIRTVKNQMLALQDVTAHQRERFEEVAKPRKVIRAYKACLAEVVRRKSSLKLYFGQAGQLAEKMAVKRGREMARRNAFNREHASLLPDDLVEAMGLLDVPSPCVVDIAPFDSGLLDIDLADIENLAPQHLAGSLRFGGDELEVDETIYSHDISGTDKLEVENARLKAQLASCLAIICSLDSSVRPESMGDPEDQEIKLDDHKSRSPVERTAEALRLKDEHAKQLKRLLEEKQEQCLAYESRILDLEKLLREQDERNSELLQPGPFVTEMAETEVDMSSSGNRAEQSGVTGVAEPEPMVDSTRSEERILLGECDMNIGDEVVEQLPLSHETLTSSELSELRGELDANLELLKESQMNSVHLENRLHEIREESRIYKCGADRRATEYKVLRTSTVKLRCFLERLRQSLASPTSPGELTESLRAIAASLGSTPVDEVEVEFQAFVRTLADRVIDLAQQCSDLAERCKHAETSQLELRKEAEEKTSMAKNLFAKCKLEKQASREKICLMRFDVHQLALFLPNADGHYEALNRNCPNYFLSEESVALFREHVQGGGKSLFILGQIVHIERYVAKLLNESSDWDASLPPRLTHNPYGLANGAVFYVVTVAMVPGL